MILNTQQMIQADYQARPIRLINRWTIETFRLKVYSIAHDRQTACNELIESARRVVTSHLREHPTRQEHYGVGFVGIHDGRGENQVFLDLWVNQNELLHTYWTSSKTEPADLRLGEDRDHNSVCVWDLFVQCCEREAWIRNVIGNSTGPDLEAYWNHAYEGMV